MIQADYNTAVTRAAQFAVIGTNNKTVAKSRCKDLVSGMRGAMLPNLSTCLSILVWSPNSAVGGFMLT